MDQPSLLTISKNESLYVLQGLYKLLQDVHCQEVALARMALPGDETAEKLTEYYERRKLDLQTMIVKYKKVFS